MNTDYPRTTDITILLESARNAPASERPHALQALAKVLANHDPFTVASIAEQVKAFRLCNKGDFLEAVRAARIMIQASAGLSVKPTDDELADKWIAKHPLTAYGLGEFRRYEHGIWPVKAEIEVKKEILEELELAKDVGIKPTSRLLGSVGEVARVKVSLPGVEWDCTDEFLPCNNGVLAFSNRALLPHSPDWYFTAKLDYDYDPKVDCPSFKYALRSTVPEAANFLQEFTGYALTADTGFEIALWLFGPPGSGKSSIVLGLQAMLGSRAGTLGLRNIERSQFALTNVIGKTLIVSTEQPSMSLTATDILNTIISGESIEIDRKFRDPIQITPHAKMVWAMNELPQVKEPGNGLFRRIKVIQFPLLEESKRDPRLKESIKHEGAGILNWALDGLDRLSQRGHFEIPNCVRTATEGFQQSNDVPGIFIAQECLVGPDFKTQSSFLYNAYKIWCLHNGHKPQSITSVAEDWRRLGFSKYEANGRVWWRGVGLRAQVDGEERISL